MLIGLAGAMGSGKDTVGDALVRERGFTRYGFADALRAEVAAAILSGDYPHYVRDIPSLMFIVSKRLESPYDKPYSPEMRLLLQLWGTEYRRETCGEDYWLRQMPALTLPAVITDVRFPNEVKWVQAQGGEMWRVIRTTTDMAGQKHKSETVLRNHIFDRNVYNDRSIEELERLVLSWVPATAVAA